MSPSRSPLLVDVNIDIQCNQHILITGPNGSGKTTFLRHVCKHVQNQKKKVTYMYLPQVPIVAPGRYFWQQIAYPSDTKPPTEDLMDALARSGMSEYFETLPHGFDTIAEWDDCLSFGQKQRISLSRIFLHKPVLALLDESTTGMDTSSAVTILTELQKISTCIAVTHNPDAFRGIFTLELSVGSSTGNTLGTGWELTSLVH